AGTAVLAGVLGVAYSLRFVHDAFFGQGPRALPVEPHEPPVWLRVPVAVLVAVCLAVGIVPSLMVEPTLKTAVAGTLGAAAPDFTLAVWHGWNLPLAMSIAGVVGGLLFYFALRRLFTLQDAMLRTWG